MRGRERGCVCDSKRESDRVIARGSGREGLSEGASEE